MELLEAECVIKKIFQTGGEINNLSSSKTPPHPPGNRMLPPPPITLQLSRYCLLVLQSSIDEQTMWSVSGQFRWPPVSLTTCDRLFRGRFQWVDTVHSLARDRCQWGMPRFLWHQRGCSEECTKWATRGVKGYYDDVIPRSWYCGYLIVNTYSHNGITCIVCKCNLRLIREGSEPFKSHNPSRMHTPRNWCKSFNNSLYN